MIASNCETSQPIKIDRIATIPTSHSFSYFLTHSLKSTNPVHFKDALKHPEWVATMNDKLMILGIFVIFHQEKNLLGASGFIKPNSMLMAPKADAKLAL